MTSSLLFVCLFCDISNGAFDKVFKLQVIFMKSACWAVLNKRERCEAKLGWFFRIGINSKSILPLLLSSIFGYGCLKLFVASIFYFLLSRSWMLPLKICSQVWKFKSNIFGNWLNLWQHTYNIYIYLVIALYRAISNTLQVCTIHHSMWKSQKFITIKHWKFILCPRSTPPDFHHLRH